MATRGFLKLPEELQLMILGYLGEEDPKSAVLARGVCTTFLRLINHELMSRTSVSSVLQVANWWYYEENAFNFLKARVKSIPEYVDRLHLNEGEMNEEYQWPNLCEGTIRQYLSFILKQLLKSAPQDTNLSTLKEQYTNDLLRALAYKMTKVDYDHEYWFPREKFMGSSYDYRNPNDLENILQPDLKGQIYTAAAAVGNTVAFEACMRSPYPDDCPMMREILRGRFGSLSFPMELAALNNKVDIIKKFLDHQVPYAIKNYRRSYMNDFVCFVAKGPLKVATVHGQLEAAKVLIDFLAKHYSSTDLKLVLEGSDEDDFVPVTGAWSDVLESLVGVPMKQGCTEIFKHSHGRFHKIQSVHGYTKIFVRSFIAACEMGHAEFIRYIIRSGQIALLKEQVFSDPPLRHFCDEPAHPILTAAAFSRISVLEALFTEETYNVHHPGLLRAAVFGINETCYDYPQWTYSGFRYTVTRFLIKNGLPINKSAIGLINEYAMFCLKLDGEYLPKHTPIRLSGDRSMTLLLLIEAIKKQYRSGWLRKQLWVPVRKALGLIVETGLDLPDGYTSTAKVLLKWIEGR